MRSKQIDFGTSLELSGELDVSGIFKGSWEKSQNWKLQSGERVTRRVENSVSQGMYMIKKRY